MKKQSAAYERKKAAALRRGLETSAKERDIGPPPKCTNTRLRKRIEADPELFLTTLWPKLFKWKFSADQVLSIRQFDEVTERGGLQAIADPRGTGKTQRVIRQALKAILTGKRRYVCIVAATEPAARRIIKALRMIVCYHAVLQGLFPNELHGFAQLNGTNRLAGGQLCEGRPTGISVAADQIIFPTIPGSRCSGAIITSCGITGNLRGQFHTMADGTVVRPDLPVIDDPQTRESAKSRAQTEERMELIEGDVMGLVGPDTPIACVVLCTVIREDDLSERILKDPKWHGRRTKTLLEMPTNENAWEEYFEAYDAAIREGKPQKINALYKKRRKELDAGCKVAWKDRIEAGCVSAIQTAMHIRHRMGEAAFAAECQNEPYRKDVDLRLITADEILTRLNAMPRGEVPLMAQHLTASIDVHKKLLYWKICWWADNFTGGSLDYGEYPKQGKYYFALDQANPTLQQFTRRKAQSAAVRAGLDTLIEYLAGLRFKRNGDGAPMQIERICIDANWGEETDTVYAACRESSHAHMLRPTHGSGLKRTSKPMAFWKESPGEKNGHHWFRRMGKRGVRYLLIDTNYWKTFLHNGLSLAPEEPHSISLFNAPAHEHRMLADHLTAEARSKDGDVDRWDQLPNRENHRFDNFTLCAVGASELGVTLTDKPKTQLPPKRTGPIKAKYY